MNASDKKHAENLVGLILWDEKKSKSNVMGINGQVINFPYTLATAISEVRADLIEMFHKGEIGISPESPNFEKHVKSYAKLRFMYHRSIQEYDIERAKELKAMDKDPSLIQNDKSFKDFKQYLEELPPKIQQAALDLLQDSYRNGKSN